MYCLGGGEAWPAVEPPPSPTRAHQRCPSAGVPALADGAAGRGWGGDPSGITPLHGRCVPMAAT